MFDLITVDRIAEKAVDSYEFQEKAQNHFDNSMLPGECSFIRDEEAECIGKTIGFSATVEMEIDLLTIFDYLEDTSAFYLIKEDIKNGDSPDYDYIDETIEQSIELLKSDNDFFIKFKLDQFANIFESYVKGSEITFAIGDREITKTFEEAFPEVDFAFDIKTSYKNSVNYTDYINTVKRKMIETREIEEY